MEMKDILMHLSDMNGPVGHEGTVSTWLCELVKPFCDEAYTDLMGNLIAVRKSGKENAPKVVVDAHIDEIGLIVTGHEKGFLRFASLGGVDARVLPALQVRVMTEPPIKGIVASMPPHTLSAADMDRPVAIDQMVIDVGMTQEEAEAKIALGTPVTFDISPVMLGDHRICGKSLDDRACAAIICKVMERLANTALNCDVYYMFSAQEEVGGRGAQAGVFDIAPDYAIVLDVKFAKTPDENGIELCDMGGGASIGIGPNMNYAVTQKLIALAKELNIPYQMDVIRGSSGTNAWPVQISRGGVATAVISLPQKYMHTPHEVVDLRDMQVIVDLVCAYLERF